jgi:hypothetical protein
MKAVVAAKGEESRSRSKKKGRGATTKAVSSSQDN